MYRYRNMHIGFYFSNYICWRNRITSSLIQTFHSIFRAGDVERKLKEAEAREEALLRRITEKEKALNKMR